MAWVTCAPSGYSTTWVTAYGKMRQQCKCNVLWGGGGRRRSHQSLITSWSCTQCTMMRLEDDEDEQSCLLYHVFVDTAWVPTAP